MAKSHEVLTMLCPDIEYALIGDKYEDINWFGKKAAITKEQFEAGFSQYDAWKTKNDADTATAKAAAEGKLAALGLTTDDLRALGL